jgi:hypothetical protein
MTEVKANEVKGWDDLKVPGDFIFTTMNGHEGPAGMVMMCPCGCGDISCVAFDVPARTDDGPKWGWNGSREKPTLSPSLKKITGCEWHGHLVDGVFRPC